MTSVSLCLIAVAAMMASGTLNAFPRKLFDDRQSPRDRLNLASIAHDRPSLFVNDLELTYTGGHFGIR